MHTTISIITGAVLMLLALWLLVKSHKQIGTKTRSFGIGAFLMAFTVWFGYSRVAFVPPWFVPVFGLAGVVLLGLMVHFFRLIRHLSYGEPRADIFDLIFDGIISRFVK